MAVYLRYKAERLRMTWEDADSLRVNELFELNGELPLESQREICTETFELHQSHLKLHLCPWALMLKLNMEEPSKTSRSRTSLHHPHLTWWK
jgi:hypothetical protein